MGKENGAKLVSNKNFGSEESSQTAFGEKKISNKKKIEKMKTRLEKEFSDIPESIENVGFKLSKFQIASQFGLQGREEIIDFIDKQRDKISKTFMENKNDPKVKYSLNNIRNVIQEDYSDEKLLDILFYCPFRFPDQDEMKDFNPQNLKYQ